MSRIGRIWARRQAVVRHAVDGEAMGAGEFHRGFLEANDLCFKLGARAGKSSAGQQRHQFAGSIQREVSSKPPTWVSLDEHLRHAAAAAGAGIISSCFAGSRSMRIFSISVTPRTFEQALGSDAIGADGGAVTSRLWPWEGSLFLGDGQVGAFHAMMPPAWLYTVSNRLFSASAGTCRALAAAAGDQDRLALELVELLDATGQLARAECASPWGYGQRQIPCPRARRAPVRRRYTAGWLSAYRPAPRRRVCRR